MWVVQETLLSTSAYVLLGKTMVSWDTMCLAASNLLHHANNCCRKLDYNNIEREYAVKIIDYIDNCVQVIQSFQRIPHGSDNDLLAHLWTFRNRLASVKHDKVYGIMGLLHRKDSLLRPDYEEHFTSLCRSVILKDIQLSNNLNALQGIRESDSPDVTSWSIDWSFLDYWSEDRLRVLNSIYKRLYDASLGRHPRAGMYDVGISGVWGLQVAGRVLDHVVYSTPCLEFYSHIDENLNYKGVLTALKTLVILKNRFGDKTPYIAGGSYFNALWRTLLADCIIPHKERHSLRDRSRESGTDSQEPSMRRANRGDFLAFMLWLLSVSGGHFMMHGVMLDRDGDLVADRTNKYSTDEVLSYQYKARRLRELKAVQRIGASVVRATSGRCLFVTSQGYIGLGPYSLDHGDSIAILLGGHTPFVLEPGSIERLEAEHWKLLGDCYVHGWMDGELVRSQDTQEWENVVLV